MEERRRFIRIPESLQITYRQAQQPKSSKFITKDISQKGIRFFVHDFVPINSILRIKIEIKKMLFSFEAIARVIWIKKEPYSNRYEVGAQFSEIPKDSLSYLIEYIKEMANE